MITEVLISLSPTARFNKKQNSSVHVVCWKLLYSPQGVYNMYIGLNTISPLPHDVLLSPSGIHEYLFLTHDLASLILLITSLYFLYLLFSLCLSHMLFFSFPRLNLFSHRPISPRPIPIPRRGGRGGSIMNIQYCLYLTISSVINTVQY